MDTEDVAEGIEFIYDRGKDAFREQCRLIVEKIKNRPNGWMQLYDFIMKEN